VLRELLTRSIRPPDDITPNANDPADVPPATVGPTEWSPGDPEGVLLDFSSGGTPPPPVMRPMPWSGWPAQWWTPNWYGRVQELTDTAWVCVDLNASILSSMNPYLVDAAPTLDYDWINNPDPDTYASWNEFAKALFWDFQLGEAFVLATARYATGWPARFHVVPPWAVEVDLGDNGLRTYTIGDVDVSTDMLHLRYSGSVDDARGHGPLEALNMRLVAAGVLQRYANSVGDLIPSSILEAPDELDAEQSQNLRDQWVSQRIENPGLPGVLSGGLKWTPTQMSPRDMALLDMQQHNESRIAIALGVPPFLVGLPSGGDSMTYSNVSALFDYHWRASLRPKAAAVMAGLSGWLVPRGTSIEVNKDSYVQPDPKTRAETAKILVDMGVMTVEQVQEAEMLNQTHVVGGPISE